MRKVLVISTILLAACTGSRQEQGMDSSKATEACESEPSNPQRISIAALLANPDAYEGKAVTVIGYYHGSFEHSAIYLTQADFQHDVLTNGLWVTNVVPETLNNRYIMLDGIFTTSQGHLGQWSGTICGISRTTAWGPDEP